MTMKPKWIRTHEGGWAGRNGYIFPNKPRARGEAKYTAVIYGETLFRGNSLKELKRQVDNFFNLLKGLE